MKELYGRFSVLSGDPGYGRFAEHGFNAGWRVTVDGRDIPKVVTADTDSGVVVAHQLNSDGDCFIRNGAVATKSHPGRVRVFIGVYDEDSHGAQT